MSEVEVAISNLAESLSGLLCCNSEDQMMIHSYCSDYDYPCDSNPTYGILCPELVETRQTLEYEINQMLGMLGAENWILSFCNPSCDTNTTQEGTPLKNQTHYTYQKRKREFQTTIDPPPRAYHLSSSSAFYRVAHESLFTRSFDDISHNNDVQNGHFSTVNSFQYEDNKLCYDSDPEICYNTTPLSKKKSSTTNFPISKSKEESTDCEKDRYSSIEDDDNDDDCPFVTFCSSSEDDDDSSAKSNLSYGIAYANDNDDYMSTAFQTFINENLTLVHHPSPTDKSNRNTSPICVTAWIEMGTRLKKHLIQPTFMWREVYSNVINKKQKYKKHTYTYQPPESIELLSIVRVLKPTTINRNHHPFVKLCNSFTLHDCNDGIYLFEARDAKSCDRIVHGLKIIIARLASQIIIGDNNAFTEFFTHV